MLFRSRKPVSLRERLRLALWPRRSWKRSLRYYAKRLGRLRASPHAVAAGLGAGVFASISPFLGFHYVLAFALTYVFRGNFIAAAIGATFGNPVTYPFIWAASYGVGRMIVPGRHRAQLEPDMISAGLMHHSWERLWPMLKPLAVGSMILGVIAAVLTYFIARFFVRAYQHARHNRMLARHPHLAHRHQPGHP